MTRERPAVMSGVMALPGRSWLIIVVSSCVRFVEIEVRPPRPLVVPSTVVEVIGV